MLDAHTLPMIWGWIMAFVIFAYVVLDGFDLGVGILFGAERERAGRDVMVNSIAPVWDGNETWLVLGGSCLYGAFPVAYSVILPAVYVPVTSMLMGLLLRGVSFEFRFRATTLPQRYNWDRGFLAGSVLAAFCQGVILGTVLQGTRVVDDRFAGGPLAWLAPFPLFTGLAVLAGYGLLGATWLVWRTEGALQQRMRGRAKVLAAVMLALIGVVSAWTPFLHVAYAARWFAWPGLVVTGLAPLGVVVLAAILFRALARVEGARVGGARHDKIPFLAALGLFLVTFLGLGYSLYPYIVPGALTIWQAASPVASQSFLLVGAAVMIPIIIAYNGFAYYVFHGKVSADVHYH